MGTKLSPVAPVALSDIEIPAVTTISFDLDGVLANTQAVVNNLILRQASKWKMRHNLPTWIPDGVPYEYEAEAWCLGADLLDYANSLYRGLPHAQIYIDAWAFPEVRALFLSLQIKGHRVVVMTSRPTVARPATLRWLSDSRICPDILAFVDSYGKASLAVELGVTIAFEDNPKTIDLLCEKPGITVYKPDFPYTRNCGGIAWRA